MYVMDYCVIDIGSHVKPQDRCDENHTLSNNKAIFLKLLALSLGNLI